MNFLEIYNSDLSRYSRLPKWNKKWHYYFRKCQATKNKVLKLYYRYKFQKISVKHGIEIPWRTSILGGLYIGHSYGITINQDAKLGKNINIHKGVTIGQENRGKRKGSPTIGNNVWIGINATIVGNVTIGDDVLIAPNSYVNIDVPSHSIVIGNPCVIHHKDEATKDYINSEVI